MKNSNKTNSGNKFDVIFNDDNDSNSKGFNTNYEMCKLYIDTRTGGSYFEDYKGGTVSIVNVDTDEVVYQENI